MIAKKSKDISNTDSDLNLNTGNSQKSLFSLDTQVSPFQHGQIVFEDGLQRLRQVFQQMLYLQIFILNYIHIYIL